MLNRCKPLYRAAVISPVLLFVLCSITAAREGALIQDQQIVFPSADKEIAISVRMSDDRMIVVSQYEGEMIRIGREDGEIGITLRVLDKGSVKIDFFRIVDITKGKEIIGESVTGTGSLVLNNNLPQSPHINQISTIQLLSVSKIVKTNNPEEECPCCVTCGGVKTCGLSVQVSCGSCRCPS